MSTREQVHAAYETAMTAWEEVRRLDALKHFPGADAAYRRAYDKWQAAERKWERLAAEEEPQDQPPTPDLRSDEDREIDAAIAEEVALERGSHDSHWTQGGTRD